MLVRDGQQKQQPEVGASGAAGALAAVVSFLEGILEMYEDATERVGLWVKGSGLMRQYKIATDAIYTISSKTPLMMKDPCSDTMPRKGR